jgi:hypothetical protein
MKVSVVSVRTGVPVPPIVGGLAAFAKAKNESSSRIVTDTARILHEFSRIFRVFAFKFEDNFFSPKCFYFPFCVQQTD